MAAQKSSSPFMQAMFASKPSSFDIFVFVGNNLAPIALEISHKVLGLGLEVHDRKGLGVAAVVKVF